MKNSDTKICLKCYKASHVVDSRYEDAKVYRKRRCPDCGRVWETVEIIYEKGKSA